MAKTVVGMYDDKSIADRVVQDLQTSGFERDAIRVTQHTADESHLTHSLEQAGIPQDDAQYYAEGVRRGAVLVTVDSPDRSAEQAAGIMDRYDPINVDERANEWRQGGWQAGGRDFGAYGSDQSGTGTTRRMEDEGDVTLPVTEEQMQVGKRQVQTGGTRIRTYVTEQPVEETVNLRKENVNVERRPVDRPISDADRDAFQERTIEVPEVSEQAVVGKEARVTEEVRVHKDVEEQPETIRDTVQRTNVETEDLGEQWGSGQSRYRAFDSYEPTFRDHFKNNFRGQQYNYDQYRPAYRYGYDLATGDQYRGRNWNEIEPDVRRDWERQHPNNAWDNFKGAVRQGFESISNG